MRDDLSRAFGQNDIEDFERQIARATRGRTDEEAQEVRSYLLANPGQTVRDYKGKGPTIPSDRQVGEKHWTKLRRADVQAAATTAFARDLPHNIRQAAASDPGLIWNNLARKYRKRLPSDPPGGGHESYRLGSEEPAAVTRIHAIPKNPARTRLARVSPRAKDMEGSHDRR